MRGTLPQPVRCAKESGIIPAYAGNTKQCFHYRFVMGDHPRVCGEHSLSPRTSRVGTGSSPRMRGTRHHSGRCAFDGGIIPAYAGNTIPVRGLARIIAGSSPRMRGTPAVYQKPHILAGIIPAYAGNTYVGQWRQYDQRDHPRVCGEHITAMKHVNSMLGSSPRMRGTLVDGFGKLGIFGIIPAYAGNTKLPADRH